MNTLPDIVIIDFCEWLSQKIRSDKLQSVSPLDIILDRNHSDILELYAKQFLHQRKEQESACPVKSLFYQFLSSEEFNHVIKSCERHCDLKQSKFYDTADKWDYCMYCLHRVEIDHAFRHFVNRTGHKKEYLNINNIPYYDLAAYIRHLLYSDDDIKRSPQFMQLMINSKAGIAEEIDFFEWLQLHNDDPTSVRKMPSIVFEKLVDDYIASSNKGEQEKKQLMKAYRQTGWEALLEQFQVLFKMKKTRRTMDFDKILRRYYSHNARFNCIILPLSDKESQKYYQSLITDSWNDLNELSENYLDIYYSETDNGKSGYDVAKRISSLPDALRKKAPCLVIWEYNINEAKAIPIDELNDKQILSVIKCIVEKIQQTEDLELIVKEASKLVKNFQTVNHCANIVHIEGHGNIVGDNNKVNTSVTIGDNNRTNINDIQVNNQDLVNDFEKAIEEIKNSPELDDDQKTTMCEIMDDAKNATIENSAEKSQKARTAFNHIKSFIVKSAPKLISTLANLTTIASFFTFK